MTNVITSTIKFVIVMMFGFGLFLIYDSRTQKEEAVKEVIGSKPLMLKKFLLKFEKPERVEIMGLSERYKDDIEDIKKLKIAQSKESKFFVTIKLFTDETDKTAPLVAQIQFIDLKSQNLIKEESINLE